MKDLEALRPTKRFFGRESDYSAGRPGYPKKIISLLERHANFSPQTVVADVGSGTGKLAQLFLDNGNQVYGVEPNADMRREAEGLLGTYTNFQSVNGPLRKLGFRQLVWTWCPPVKLFTGLTSHGLRESSLEF